MIEFKVKKNCKRGHLLRPCWVSSALHNTSNEVIGWLTDHPLNADDDDFR